MSALISYPHGVLLMPADSPYEREVAFELADSCARRYGRVDLAFDRRAWSVTVNGHGDHCVRCRHCIVGAVYQRAHRLLCSRCARRES